MKQNKVEFTIIDAPSVLGVGATGVEFLPDAFRQANFGEKLNADYFGLVEPPPFNSQPDAETKLPGTRELIEYSPRLADAVAQVVGTGRFPVVLGGDCSIIIGTTFALRRAGRYGLFYVDGHADFYTPEANDIGLASDMDLAIVSGRGPEVLTDIENLRPLVRDADIVAFGFRDEEEQKKYGDLDIFATEINSFSLATIRRLGVEPAARAALEKLPRNEVDGFWIHFDADVLADEIMPAVDFRLPGGLDWNEATRLLQILMASGQAVGISVGIFNPRLDPDGSLVRRLVEMFADGLNAQPVDSAADRRQ